MAKLLIVIPAYNEEASIVPVVEDLIEHYPQYDYVVVNDGSRDHTAALCRRHDFRMIDLPVNLGLAGAFQTGLRYAAENGYDCALQFDADGPGTSPPCWNCWKAGRTSSSAAGSSR